MSRQITRQEFIDYVLLPLCQHHGWCFEFRISSDTGGIEARLIGKIQACYMRFEWEMVQDLNLDYLRLKLQDAWEKWLDADPVNNNHTAQRYIEEHGRSVGSHNYNPQIDPMLLRRREEDTKKFMQTNYFTELSLPQKPDTKYEVYRQNINHLEKCLQLAQDQ